MILVDLDPQHPLDSQSLRAIRSRSGSGLCFHANPHCRSFDSEVMLPYPGADQVPKGSVVLVPTSEPFTKLKVIVDLLQGPFGCPWDKEQTHQSLTKYLIEEAYEVIDAIERDEIESLREELGDLLLQPVFHMRVADRNRTFDHDAPVIAICDKLIRRHPHVFISPDQDQTREVSNSDEVLRNWDQIKKTEKAEVRSILQGIPPQLPALTRALEVSKRAARAGFEWENLDGVREKLLEELSEFEAAKTPEERENEFGDLLFTLVNIARWNKIDPESALRNMVRRFQNRFQAMELHSEKPLSDLSPEEWETLWQIAKKQTADQERTAT